MYFQRGPQHQYRLLPATSVFCDLPTIAVFCDHSLEYAKKFQSKQLFKHMVTISKKYKLKIQDQLQWKDLKQQVFKYILMIFLQYFIS